MGTQRDPVEEGSTDSADLYDIATWENRTRLDWISSLIHRGLRASAQAIVVLLAVAILAAQFYLTGLAAVQDPIIGSLVLLSVVPAFGLALYIWYADVTTSEPLGLLVGTFLLGVLFAGFAAILNTLAMVTVVPFVGMVVFFYVVVAPVEETVKLLAIRLYAFRSDRFDAVVDGAVYGAMAGLGFATIENAIYITQGIEGVSSLGSQTITEAGQTAAARLLAGPGHVIYSAFAGYYLGLAKFNRENAGPIVVKGLLIAGFIHATYNTAVTFLPTALELLDVAVSPGIAFLGFVLVYDSVFGYILYRKISRYRHAYHQTDMGRSVSFDGAGGEEAGMGAGGEEAEMSAGREEAEMEEEAGMSEESDTDDNTAERD